MTEQTEREKLITGIRDFATWLETNPEIPAPMSPRFDVWVSTREEAAEISKRMGRVEKHAFQEAFWVRKTFGPVQFDINLDRSAVCERVVVGKKLVEGSPARIVPATDPYEEDIVEWKCGSLIAPREPKEEPTKI